MLPESRVICCSAKLTGWDSEEMIETEQTLVIGADINNVWHYVEHIPNWASLMPGLQDSTILDADDSRWKLKVGVGGLLRTVNVLVHVDKWQGPARAEFSYRLEGDPVQGGGSFSAAAKSPAETEVTLRVQVEGSGPLAPMWEAMGRPLLPQFVKAFAGALKARIEEAAGSGSTATTPPPSSWFAATMRWLRGLMRG